MIFDQTSRERFAIAAAAMAVFAAYAVIFLPFLPRADGRAGADYGYFLPQLLAGYFWFEQNGLLSVPWFTPAFCGGIPYYPNMQGMYLSLPQFLTFVFGPVRALQLTFLVFAASGFAGFYILMRNIFTTARWMALAAGVLFLFNGFYVYRLLIGHLAFHAFMLVPLVAASVLACERPGAAHRLLDGWVLIGALLLAYMVQSGMVHALPPSMAGVVVIILVQALLFGFHWMPLLRLGIAVGIALALSAAKLAAALAFMGHFPREMLPLSGFGDLWQVLVLVTFSLFVVPPTGLAARWLLNNEWYPDTPIVFAHHELEYGVTYLPLLVIGGWLAYKAAIAARRRTWTAPSWTQGVLVAAITLLLCLPVVLNWYEPGWTAFLKSLPFFGNSSTLTRWFCLYVLVAILATALILDRVRFGSPVRMAVPLVVIATVVALNAGRNRDYYERSDGYDLRPVNQAFMAVREGAPVPAIGRVDWLRIGSSYRERLVHRDRNDSLLRGGSQALCYEPMFGHLLEEFPFGPLREGPMLEARDGLLNVKNPACFVYPEANSCRPGDHFPEDEIAAARAFLSYRAFPFHMPWWQQAANWFSLATLVAVLGGIGLFASRRFRVRLSWRARQA